jgi:anti-sigma regulatory factor (Ser/Thr protein kinase)
MELPLDPAYLTTARLFVAAASRQLGLEEEAVEDLKLAISEACTGAIGSMPPGADGMVQLRVIVVEGRVTFRLAADGPVAFGPASPDTDTTGLEVVAALFDDARVEATATGGSAISFSVPLPV